MLDFEPLQQPHILLFAAVFASCFFAIKYFNLRHSGSLLAVIITIASFFVLEVSLALGLLAAAALTIIIGRRDERKSLSPAAQLLGQIVIAGFLVASGWSIPYVTNPVGDGVLYLGVLGVAAALSWIVLLMNAVNWIDGVDGLAGSVSCVAFFTLAAISLLPATQDSLTLSLALIGVGAALGFLLLNAPPARIYLGTTGSWFLGLFLAITAIIGGGKIATAALVLAIPILDVFFVIIQRLKAGQPPWIGDTKHHLHHHLLSAGFTPRQIMVLFTAASGLLGVAAIMLQTWLKLWTLALAAGILIIVVLILRHGCKQNISI